jgi:hypothetical protein
VEKVPKGKFKTQCLSEIKGMQATAGSVVKVVPVRSEESGLFGFLAGEIKIVGDIESPIFSVSGWKATKK